MDPLGKILLGLLLGSRLMGGGSKATDRASAFYSRNSSSAPPVTMIAVVPFVNLSEDTQADRKVMGTLITQLLATRAFLVTEPTVVETALADLRARGQLDAVQVKQVAEKAGARLLLMGTITEYGASRASGTSLTVAMDARLVEATSTQIVWAGVVTRTARENDSLFGGGKAPSLSKLTQDAVKELVSDMMKAREQIQKFTPTVPPPTAPATGALTAGAVPGGAPPAPILAAVSNANARFLDESKEFTVEDMKAFLPTVEGVERGEIVASQEPNKHVGAFYRANGTEVRVTVADYSKAEQAQAVARIQSGNTPESKFENLPAFSQTSSFGFVHLNIVAGRFALYLRAPADQEDLAKKVASAILKSMR